MRKTLRSVIYWLFAGFVFCFLSCRHEEKTNGPVLFQVVKDEVTNLHFSNTITPTEQFNMFNYAYFYNGAGIGAGDFNNDGRIDLFFASNQGENKLYLNNGNLHFSDVTAKALVPQDHGWSTGVSVVDINNDGLLDIYVCKVGKFEILHSKNQLLICQGIKDGVPTYRDEAREYGLDFSGFSTQALFFDYDRDGDLDMFLLNHSVHQNSSFMDRNHFTGTYGTLSGDRLFRNDNNVFTEVTRQSHIYSTEIGYGLGVAVSDLNLDGWPDLYVGNDFHENDYLYINQKDGTFSEENNSRLMHTSKFTMGIDIADLNNDGYPEIISTDMQAEDPYILKRSLGDDDYDVFFSKISSGYNYQYSRNNLQYNRRNGMFSETGIYSGISATDWSWGPLLADFNNDGRKDLFISNGIPKRLNDIDYINFVYNTEIQQKIQNKDMGDKDLVLMKKFPEIKIPNKVFINADSLRFIDMKDAIKGSLPTFSNGAVYADLDNDGDLDLVVNNINDPVLLYENMMNRKTANNYVDIQLKGNTQNINAIGSKVILFSGRNIETYEKYPVKGFMSSMEIPVHIGLDNVTVDSSFLVWPDNSFERIKIDTTKNHLSFKYKAGLPQFNFAIITSFKKREANPIAEISKDVQLNYVHRENVFNEFDREPLIPHMVSREGPALAVADINKDGLEDVFIGSSKTFHSGLFLQQTDGKFKQSKEISQDSMYEDVDATWADINNDGNTDLIVASGGNEYYGTDRHLSPRAYMGDGKGNFSINENAFSNIFLNAGCVAVSDFNHDGFPDVFIGGRNVPWNYGEIPLSYLLLNDGKGHFNDVAQTYAPQLSKIGMVTNAVWYDINKDGQNDLLVCCEWGGIYAFINSNGKFMKRTLTEKSGWWNFILPVDADNDGDIDIIAGNLGLNSFLRASASEPVRLYYNDFDDNGKKEQVVTYYLQHKEVTLAGKDELQKQIPELKKKYIYAGDFAKASFNDIFSPERIKSATILTADYFANAILINDGNLNFKTEALPWEAQLSTYRDAVLVNANDDSLPDVLLVGNYYPNSMHSGRNDADYGSILINKGKGTFEGEPLNGVVLKGETRHIRQINIQHRQAYVAARNNDSVQVLMFKEKKMR